MIELCQQADDVGLAFVSFPERHFSAFGSAFPSPAVLVAAIAMRTDRVQLRAGSVVTPLHDPLRIVEDWSVVDNLSDGRVGLSLGSGWSVDDFVLADRPAQAFEERRATVRAHVTELRELWAGNASRRRNAAGITIDVKPHPRPIQEQLPLWLTSGGSDETFAAAGRLGVNVLTHLERQHHDILAKRVALYRAERERAGHFPEAGVVTLMQHALISDNATREGEAPLRSYLTAALKLETEAIAHGGKSSGGSPVLPLNLLGDDAATLIDNAVTRYLTGASFIGTEVECRRRALDLLALGVDEVACLVDFVSDRNLARRTVAAIGRLAQTLSGEALTELRAKLAATFNNPGLRDPDSSD